MPDRLTNWFAKLLPQILMLSRDAKSPNRYNVLRRNMIILMIVVTVIPLLLMASINYHMYQNALRGEVLQPIRVLLNKTKNSFELFLAERLSAVSFIASAYTFDELSDQAALQRIFQVMRQEFGGFVDLGMIDATGRQVSYAGPYELLGKNYKEQAWFQEVRVKGAHISDVFMGYRKFPHFVIAVQNIHASGQTWIIRATIDTEKFNNLILAMGLGPHDDAFLLNREDIVQTPSKFYGQVFQKCALPMPPVSFEPTVADTQDPQGRDILLAYTDFLSPAFRLVLVKPKSEVLKTWVTLKSELFWVFVASTLLIFTVVFKLTNVMVKRIEELDHEREMAYHEMEYTAKLASIGRLAAGVAHEINNPLAIINEKAGLMKDIIAYPRNGDQTDRYLALTESILNSVERCRAITHRLLGFARRMDVTIELLDPNEVLQEVMGFLEKEALHRSITVHLNMAEDLPPIASDRGQLQQVFLNILNNAFAAVDDGGNVDITSWEEDPETICVSIRDDGIGMSEETLKHIFEPFFSTKKGYGTGLGLSITYGIVKKLGGHIDVQSKAGAGTNFTVYLPKDARQGSEK